MPASVAVHVELIVEDPPRDELRSLLHGAGYEVGVRSFKDPPHQVPAHLYIVDAGRQSDQALWACRQLRSDQAENYTPILFVSPDAQARLRLASLEYGADTALARPFAADELLAQAQALVRIKERHDQLSLKAAEANRATQRLQAANTQMDQELVLARRLQESFLPQKLPQLPKARFAVRYKPCAQVGGDFYDAFRLDEKHVGFYIADAMGHGVPASLLTIFVKKGVRAKDINGQSYRLVPPNEVLERLNKDLVDQHLEDLPFITMAYMLLNAEDGTLQFARAGHPHPLYIPARGKPILWQMDGSLLGVFDTRYRLQTQTLKAGDKLLLYTDGMDGASFEQHPVGLASLLAAVEHFRDLPIDELLERLTSDLFTQTRQADDLTLFGVEV